MFHNKPIILNEKMIAVIKKRVWVRLPEQCWLWRGCCVGGYGQFHIKDDGGYLAHRVAYVIHYGEFDWNLDVLHTCDNPPCCNPMHLFLGTDFDNQQDSYKKKRNSSIKLDDDEIAKIRFKAALGITQDDLAKEFGISRPQVSRIVNYKRRS